MKTDKQQNIGATCMALSVLSELARKNGHAMLAYLIDIALRSPSKGWPVQPPMSLNSITRTAGFACGSLGAPHQETFR
ncbi:hypothetical protein FHS21_004092 [Phyllobacterium trifolii]|uniref:Uncharacterized protein n=1 Tax=Phyllobacterium trifolii TaxID=300193 RepID=A0A839U9Y0_9HYPH|nr:hypothetical protein [Phyllobacterium trifolii]